MFDKVMLCVCKLLVCYENLFLYIVVVKRIYFLKDNKLVFIFIF